MAAPLRTAVRQIRSGGGALIPKAASLAISVAIFWMILWNQLRVRPARTNLTLPIILLALGASDLSTYAAAHPLSDTAAALMGATLLFGAVALGALRAYTVRLREREGAMMRQGTWVTAALSIVGIALHALLDSLAGTAAASYPLYREAP